MQDEKKKADEQHQKQIAEQENKMREMNEQQVFFTHFFLVWLTFISFSFHLRQTSRKARNWVCQGGATQNLPPQYKMGVCIRGFTGTGSGTPPGHTQILRPHNL